MIQQLPVMLRQRQREHAATAELVRELRIEAIISDQRFGVWHPNIPSVILTHQLHPFTPMGQFLLRRSNLRWLAPFDQIWVVDDERPPGLAGELSHPPIDERCKYLGALSRLQDRVGDDEAYRVVAIVSGPEPQRSLFEEILEEQLCLIPGRHLLVQGLPGKADRSSRENITRFGHLPDAELASAMLGAELVICRSGYSSIMDLHALQLPALLVPTPGQPEQVYLASLHGRTASFMSQEQRKVDIKSALLWRAHARKGFIQLREPALVQALQDLDQLIGHTVPSSPTFEHHVP